MPSSVPTYTPTLAPSASTVVEIAFEQSVQGVTSEEFLNNSNASAAFIASVASSMNIAEDTIVITNVTDGEGSGNGTRRRLRHGEEQRRLNTPSELVIDYTIEAVIQSLGFQNASDAIFFLTTTLSGSISSGNFSAILKDKSVTLGISVLVNVTANTVTVTNVKVSYNSASPSSMPTAAPSISFAPTAIPTSDPATSTGGVSDTSFDTVLLAVIIVVVVLGVVLIALCSLCMIEKKKKKASQVMNNE